MIARRAKGSRDTVDQARALFACEEQVGDQGVNKGVKRQERHGQKPARSLFAQGTVHQELSIDRIGRLERMKGPIAGDEELGNLEAGFLLEFFLEKIGPTIYNRAVSNAQTLMQGKLLDIDGELFESEPVSRRQVGRPTG